ncbi:MAG: hypothetical protein NC191_05775 [Muribaculaceae bacterium]|nr:hypothetical protein [Muribaculaceae bacterium]
MKILSSIGKVFKGGPAQVAAKAAGIAGLGIVASDAHKIAKVQAEAYSARQNAKATSFYINNTLYTDNMSSFEDSVRNKALQMQLDQTWRRFFNLGIGYVKGFGSMLVEHVVPLGLGIGALFTKGKVSKSFAAVLGGYTAFKVIKNFFGIGSPKDPLA